MKNILLLGTGLLTLFISITPTKAQAFDSFSFYCTPYTKPFEDGKHYIPADSTPTSGSQCWFQIPSDLAANYPIEVGVYKGTVGNAQFLFGQNIPSLFPFDTTAYNHLGAYFSISDANGNLIHPKQDDNFFAVVYDAGSWDTNGSNPIGTQFANFFTTGGSAPNDHYRIIKWKWGAKPPSEWDPVIIIPGILGSWENVLGQWTLDPMTHIYDNLISTLEANGYIENKTLFKFPYDWEKSNIDTAKLLAQKISEIRETCSCNKVDLVAHSMGGLVATQYIESSDYKDDVDQLIMLGTPLAGSPSAYRTWEAGQVDFTDPTTNIVMGRIFARESSDNGYSTVAEYLQNKPVSSIRELLPISNYLKQGSNLLLYPTGYPQNTFLQNLIGDPTTYYNKVFKKVEVSVVVGDAGSNSTVIGYSIKPSTQLPLWKDGEPTATTTGTGDGTVPFDNSVYFSGPDLTLKGVQHSDLASSSEAYVFSKLTGGQPTKLISTGFPLVDKDWATLIAKTFPSSSDFPFFEQMVQKAFNSQFTGHILLLITLFSPIDVKITAPDGKQIGKDLSSNNVFNDIPNARYSGPIGEHEYVVIEDPLPGQYKVETVGTGSGEYTVAAGRIDAATTTSSLVRGTTTLNQIISNTLFVSSTSTAIALTPPFPPVATSTPTTTALTPDTCASDIAKAYKDKWIGKKAVADNIIFDCKALKPLFAAKDKARTTLAKNVAIAAIKLLLADMELLAKNKSNAEDAVSLIIKYTSWFRNNELH